MRRVFFIVFGFVIGALFAQAQQLDGLGVAYYDVDRLYDTIPSKIYDDSDFTPDGRMGWDSVRYGRKVDAVSAVIDSMALPVVALYGVENEAVVRDIVSKCKSDYAYIHREGGGYDGLDFAILYFADKFFPERVTRWGGALCVEGEAVGENLTIIVAHRCSSLGVLLSEPRLKKSNIIILGSARKLNFQKFGFIDNTISAQRRGRGNRVINGGWSMTERVWCNFSAPNRCDVYVKSWLLDEKGHPLATFNTKTYSSGPSSSLPVFIYFDKTLDF